MTPVPQHRANRRHQPGASPDPGRGVIARLVRRGWLGPLADFGRLVPGYLRVAFRGAGFRSGFLAEIHRSPGTAPALARRLGVAPEMLDALRSWLDLGVALRDLRRSGGHHGAEPVYAVRSRTLRALLRESADPLRAFYEEYAELDHRLVVEGPARMRSGTPFTLHDADAGIIARSSRAGEPWLEVAIEEAVPAQGPVRLVEVGAGSGVHIRAAARRNPALTARGLELQEDAAAQARDNLTRWGLTGRVTIEVGDVREIRGDGDADLVTLHQNIYYFPEDEQAALLAHLGTFLRPGGRVLVTTVVRDGGVGTVGLDLWGALTEGAARLPSEAELLARMRAAGYRDVAARTLGPGGMYVAVTGTWPGA